MNNFIKLFVSLAIPLTIGGIGSYFTTSKIDTWYASLEKPFFNPPDSVFGPVWTILYLIMGYSFYLIWTSKAKKEEKIKAMKLFFLQLGLNVLWSVVFFGFENPSNALMEMMALLLAVYITIKAFYPISKLAGQIMIPYLAWVIFAFILNLAIIILNS